MFQFRILAAIDERRPYWFAEQLGRGDFRLTDQSTLGGVLIKPVLSMPSVAARDDGTRPIVFAFYPQTKTDFTKLAVGDTVSLVAEEVRDSQID